MKQMIDMKDLMYINLFERITRVRTKSCFFYNNILIYAIPSGWVSRAIGKNGENVKELSRILNKKIKIIGLSEDMSNRAQIQNFISDVVKPTTFKSLEMNENEIIISGSRDDKAALIGRNRVRFDELSLIIKEFFGKTLKIV